MAEHSCGLLWEAQRYSHSSVAFILGQTLFVHIPWSCTTRRFNSSMNCLMCSYCHTLSSTSFGGSQIFTMFDGSFPFNKLSFEGQSLTDQLLQVLLGSEGSRHVRNIFLVPNMIKRLRVTNSTNLPPWFLVYCVSNSYFKNLIYYLNNSFTLGL